MIEDARQVPPGLAIDTGLCIAGGGPAGIALALRYAAVGRPTLLLESGGAAPEPSADALNEGEVEDPALHPPAARYRRRQLGGASTIWGGRCAPLDPIDFGTRAWMAHSGWPIDGGALQPYYASANLLCEAGAFAYTAEAAFPAGLRPLIAGFRGADFTEDQLERFSCPTDFGARYRAALAARPGLTVMLHATVVDIETTADGSAVCALHVANPAGVRFRVRARNIVLATGGLETPRLLLASRAVHARGIGNGQDLVGRFYMCHIAGTTGRFRPAPGRRVAHGYGIAADGTYCRRRLALRPEAQRRLGTGNFIARLHHPRPADPAHRTGALSALNFARPFLRPEYAMRLQTGHHALLLHLRNMLLDAGGTASFAAAWMRDRRLAARKLPSVAIPPRAGIYSLDFHAEQAPNPESRIGLAAATDRFGLPQLRIAWHCNWLDLHTVRTSIGCLAEDLERSGCGTLAFDPDSAEADALREGAYGGHHLGTARMSATPRTGVVDPNCRVHGMHNLYICGGAVFPTSGQANPTLTIVALALRLGDHLRGSMD